MTTVLSPHYEKELRSFFFLYNFERVKKKREYDNPELLSRRALTVERKKKRHERLSFSIEVEHVFFLASSTIEYQNCLIILES